LFLVFEEGDFDFDEYEAALTNASGFKVREMATELREKRMEKLRRAGEYFKSGSLTGKLSASHFSDEGQAMTPKVARLNRIAADKIFKERNEHFKYSNTIDLHYLTVSESQLVAKAFLKHHEGLRTGSIQIITGRGNHSNGGICKLSASILNILKGQNRKYSFDGIATFTINLY
jgi:NEDD4-binding protein 2